MKFRMSSLSMNLTATSHSLSGTLGIPLTFGTVFALSLAPLRAAMPTIVRRRSVRQLALAA